MTFDIVLVTKTPPTRAMVEAFVRQMGWNLALKGDLGGDASDLLAETRGILRSKPVFVLSGPYPAENEDFPEAVRPVVRGAGYLLEMNLPWSVGDDAVTRAVQLCQQLALTCGGAVYDPQDDVVMFPETPASPPRQARLTPIRLLTLEWYLAGTGPQDGALRFLSAVRRIWPQALPTRFGPHEPLRFKMTDPAGPDHFAAEWGEHRFSFLWKATKPVFGGSAFSSPDIPAPGGQRRKVVVSVTINGSAIEGDLAACNRAVSLFEGVAVELGAFFGAGYVVRNMWAGPRGALWAKRDTEQLDWIAGPWWIGLPPTLTWLTWFGGAYRELVAESLGELALRRDRGLLVRLGAIPMDSDQLRGRALSLPSELVVTIPPPIGAIALPAAPEVLREAFSDRRTPAARIPPID